MEKVERQRWGKKEGEKGMSGGEVSRMLRGGNSCCVRLKKIKQNKKRASFRFKKTAN